MPSLSFSGLVIVAAGAFLAPLLLGLVPRLRLPSVVLEIALGIVIGPFGFGWVRPDLPIRVLSLVGLAFLLFLSGLEVEFDRLKGRLLEATGLGFFLSFCLALLVGFGMQAAGQAKSPLLLAITLVATSLGLVMPVLKDAGQSESDFGQLVIAAGSIADFASVVLLSLFFSREATGTGTKIVLLGGFALLLVVAGVAISSAGRSLSLSAALLRLQDTTAQIRVRGAVVLLIGCVALAERFGLETILGAFLAGAILKIDDRDQMTTHPHFRMKLEALGFGFFIPIFFVASGLQFDLHALFSSASTILRVPIFFGALLLVRGIPALLYRPVLDGRRTLAAALLQATSLPFIVVASRIGVELGMITDANSAALVAAGLLSVLTCPLAALSVLRQEPEMVLSPSSAP